MANEDNARVEETARSRRYAIEREIPFNAG
jgi:hypothetical protein